ncbi:hypothetical protein GF360_01570 [candidate division WWE3 bacterium]|nr:hypothetical protein [candidate division WWE3 bacterium]
MNRFFIVALPKKENLEKLNEIRLFFNKNGFRDTRSNNVNDAHITLASGVYKDETQIETIKKTFENTLKKKKPFPVTYDHVTNVHKSANDEKNVAHNWIALRFHDKHLQDFSGFCEEILEKLGVSTTREYVEYIHKIDPRSKGESIVGDHMNMCIWCKPEKAEEAFEKCVEEAPKKIEIAKIAFRYTDENKKVRHAWEIEL